MNNAYKRLDEIARECAELSDKRRQLVEEKEKLELSIRTERANLIVLNVETLILFTRHTRSSCDDNHIDDYDTRYVCPRCQLLACKRDGYWDPNLEVNINIVSNYDEE